MNNDVKIWNSFDYLDYVLSKSDFIGFVVDTYNDAFLKYVFVRVNGGLEADGGKKSNTVWSEEQHKQAIEGGAVEDYLDDCYLEYRYLYDVISKNFCFYCNHIMNDDKESDRCRTEHKYYQDKLIIICKKCSQYND